MLVDSSTTGLSDVQISRIRSVFGLYPGIRQAILFGSRAMGLHRYGSDIDIAIDSDEITFNDLLHLKMLIDDLNLPFNVDLIHIQRIENTDLLDHIHRVGKTLYTRDNS
ncbi:nucleotidyltransferase domain-containing protein [Methanospirillum stamsii]|uniref:Polymerase beta nucleotidyltransferase domain-containing protein n=1 Tax=Methanospirillum stamsii TaxID=1277351 RepID=A0A2V2MQD3_9EURY|nr:nucleotidyltransferase domain-containing protein [Methanospirillum stamsii]PWR70322.1 hypothetical protein DLD82_16095 [Methanospirillum stamsii]